MCSIPKDKKEFKMKSGIITFIAVFILLCLFSSSFAEDEDHGGKIIFTKSVKAVTFDHKKHIDAGFDCESCHEEPFEYATGTAEESENFNHKAFAEGEYCGACHDGSSAFTSDKKTANGKCTLCHIGVKGYNRAVKIEEKKTAH